MLLNASYNSYYEKIGNNIRNIDEEIPFEISENWRWVRLNQIGCIVGGGTPSTSIKEYWNEGNIIWVTPAYMSKIKSKYINDSDRKITQFGLDNSSARLMPPKSIIMSSRAPIGYLAINLAPACTSQGCKSIVPFIKDMSEYLYFAIKSSITRIAEASSGTTFDEISGKDFGNILIPIPPICEQLKICDLISKVFGLIDEISQNYDNLKKYIRIVKSKILDNIFGENSSYKSYYPTIETNLSKLVSVNNIGDGDWVLLDDMDEQGEYSLVQLKHIGNGFYNNKSYKHVNTNFFNIHKCTEIKENYILINRLIAQDMNVCMLPNLPFKCITAVDVCWIAPSNEYNQKYLMYYLMSPCFQSKVKLSSSGTTRKRISKTNLIKIPIVIHELKYQELIVEKIENAFNILDLIIS